MTRCRAGYRRERGCLPRPWALRLRSGISRFCWRFPAAGKPRSLLRLAGLYPLVSIPIAIVALGEHIGWRESLGIVCALAAVVMLSMQSEPQTAATIHVRNGFSTMKTIGELLAAGTCHRRWRLSDRIGAARLGR